MGSKKITPAEYDAWLEQDGKGFTALELFVNVNTPIKHQCPKGELHKWDAYPSAVKQGSGCPHCSGRIPQDYNEWLEQDGRGIVALEPYVNTMTPIMHQCPEGHPPWRAMPSNIKSKKRTGCPNCNNDKRRKTPAEYQSQLDAMGKGFVALEPYAGAHHEIEHQCPEGHQWSVRPNDILNGNGCEQCRVITPSQYQSQLDAMGRGYVALEPYVSKRTPIKHQCPEGHQWPANPSDIKDGSSCIYCSVTASDANVFYIWENADDAGVYKVGITSERCADKRIGQCTAKNKMKANIILMIAVRDAREIERKALEIGEAVDYPSSLEGYTEFRRYTDAQLGAVYQLAVRSA